MKCRCEHCQHEFDAEPDGGHRLLVGDSTNAADVARLMQSERANLVFTSPPYGNQREYTTGGIGDWDALMRGVFAALPTAENAQVLVNLGLVHGEGEWHPYWESWLDWMRASGWRRFGWYVWDQGPGLMGDWNGRLAPSFEFIFHFNREMRRPNKIVECTHAGGNLGGKGLRSADGSLKRMTGHGEPVQTHRIPDSVLRISRQKGAQLADQASHPAPFPVALPEFIISAYSDVGEIVYEPFGGSGTSVLAGERTGRRVMAMEIAPQYVDLAILRWQAFSGRTAVRHDGVIF